MRRWHTCLAVMAAALLLPAIAWAAPYVPALCMTFQTLSQENQALFDLLYAAADAMEAEVELPSGTSYDDVQVVMDVLHADTPELIALGSHSTRYYQNEPDVAISVALQYKSTPETYARERRLLEDAAAAMVAEAQGTGWDRALALHDALCDAAVYDLSAPRAHDAYGALVEGRTACDGYAEAYALLCRMAGIPCSVVTGQADDGQGQGPHAWNLLSLDGTTCYVDVTWDDQDGMGRIMHWYFGLTDEQMLRDHLPKDGIAWPVCDDPSANWHVRMGTACAPGDTEEALRALFLSRMAVLMAEGTPIDLRMAEDEQLQLVQSEMETWLDQYNAEKSAGEGFYGSYVVSASPEQRCFLMDRRSP